MGARDAVETLESAAPLVMATVHPSSVWRVPGADRDAAMHGLVSDLRVLARALDG